MSKSLDDLKVHIEAKMERGDRVHLKFPDGKCTGKILDFFISDAKALPGVSDRGEYFNYIDLIELNEFKSKPIVGFEAIRFGYYRRIIDKKTKKKRWVFGGQTSYLDTKEGFGKTLREAAESKNWFKAIIPK